jgi:predicted methyltransferase
MVHVADWENDEMLTAFRKEGIQFNSDMDVTLKKKESASGAAIAGQGEGAHIRLDADQSVLEDSTIRIFDSGSTSTAEEEVPKKATAKPIR